MRRPNREISIFTLSALDVLAMSAGVFVLLLVMLMPYHRKVLDAHAALEAARIADADTVARVQTLEELGTLHRAEAEAAEAEAAALLAQAASLEAAAAERRQQARTRRAAAPDGDVTAPVIEAIDLIFVIDTTASMEPVLREVAHSLRGIVRDPGAPGAVGARRRRRLQRSRYRSGAGGHAAADADGSGSGTDRRLHRAAFGLDDRQPHGR